MTAPVLASMTENGRYYTHPTKHASVPSVTNIINMKSKPLFRAGLKEAARYASEHHAEWGTLDKDAVYKLVSDPPRAEAAPSVIGDIVHNWIDRFIKGQKVTIEEAREAPITARRMWERFQSFHNYAKPEYTASEFTVWSDKWGYAGTADFSFRSPAYGGAHILADTKTGKAAYPEVAMQVSAIANADFIIDANGVESPIPEYDRYAVLHLRPMSYTLHPIFRIEEAFRSFLALKAVFDWNVNHAPKSIGFAPKVSA